MHGTRRSYRSCIMYMLPRAEPTKNLHIPDSRTRVGTLSLLLRIVGNLSTQHVELAAPVPTSNATNKRTATTRKWGASATPNPGVDLRVRMDAATDEVHSAAANPEASSPRHPPRPTKLTRRGSDRCAALVALSCAFFTNYCPLRPCLHFSLYF